MAHIELDTDRVILNSRYLPSEIRQKPAIDMAEQAALAGIPVSTLEKIYSEEGSPGFTSICTSARSESIRSKRKRHEH